MRVFISYPPLESDKGTAQLGQNRQFQWFNTPSSIYPMVPAYAATLLKSKGYDVFWDDAIAKQESFNVWINRIVVEKPDLVAFETKTTVVKQHWEIINLVKDKSPKTKVVLMGDHTTKYPGESLEKSKVDFVITGGDYDFLLLSLCDHLDKGAELEPGIWYRKNNKIIDGDYGF